MVEKVEGPVWLDTPQTVNGQRWLTGTGPMPSSLMVICDKPSFGTLDRMKPYSGDTEGVVSRYALEAGIDLATVYRTYACKYIPHGKKPVGTADHRINRPFLMEEIRRCNPRLIICMGSAALKMLYGNSHKIGEYRGTVQRLPGSPDVQVYCTNDPGYFMRNPQYLDIFQQDWLLVEQLWRNPPEPVQYNHVVLNSADEVGAMVDYMLALPSRTLSLDCEWHGVTWMSPDRYIRTVQIAPDRDTAITIEFYDEGAPVPDDQEWTIANRRSRMDDHAAAWRHLKRLFEDPGTKMFGHNAISDGEWLLSYGIDIRDNVDFDTMLAEYVLNESGPFGLEALSCRYAPFGRYDLAVLVWKSEKRHRPWCEQGFGAIPAVILNPYGAIDVLAPWYIRAAQEPRLEPFRAPRGPAGQYPSLWQTTLDSQRNIYEMEITGMRVDRARLEDITQRYQEKLTGLNATVTAAASAAGLPDFNPRAVQHVQKLLYTVLGLTPIKSTDNKPWREVKHYRDEDQLEANPSTDKNTLEILQTRHPIVKLLLNQRRLDTAIKTTLADGAGYDEQSKGGGLASKIWPDGRTHTHFSQLSDTGRFRHSKPNSANFGKKAEGYLKDIFGGADLIPPGVRTIFIPTDGHVYMEADFCQAELFVMASLADDDVMLSALTTPGKDLHDLTAIGGFKLKVLATDGTELSMDQMVALARYLGKDAYEKLRGDFRYVTALGKTLTRKEFSAGFRVSAKNLQFGLTPILRSASLAA